MTTEYLEELKIVLQNVEAEASLKDARETGQWVGEVIDGYLEAREGTKASDDQTTISDPETQREALNVLLTVEVLEGETPQEATAKIADRLALISGGQSAPKDTDYEERFLKVRYDVKAEELEAEFKKRNP